MFFPLGRLFNAKFTVHLDVALFHSLLLFWQPWAVGWAHPTNQWAGGWHSTIFKTLPSFYDVQSCFGSIFFVHMIHIYIYIFILHNIHIHTQVHHLYQYPLKIYENITPEAPQSEPSHTGASEKKNRLSVFHQRQQAHDALRILPQGFLSMIELEFVDSREANHANPGFFRRVTAKSGFCATKASAVHSVCKKHS